MTNPIEFAEPGVTGGDMLKPAEIIGRLLVVRTLEYIPEMLTKQGMATAVRVDVIDVGDQMRRYSDVLWFNKLLVGALKGRLGELCVGKIGTKPMASGNMAYEFISLASDPQIVELARTAVGYHPDFTSKPVRSGNPQPPVQAQPHVQVQPPAQPQPPAQAPQSAPPAGGGNSAEIQALLDRLNSGGPAAVNPLTPPF